MVVVTVKVRIMLLIFVHYIMGLCLISYLVSSQLVSCRDYHRAWFEINFLKGVVWLGKITVYVVTYTNWSANVCRPSTK